MILLTLDQLLKELKCIIFRRFRGTLLMKSNEGRTCTTRQQVTMKMIPDASIKLEMNQRTLIS